MITDIKNISIVGAGKVAFHLSKAFYEQGLVIDIIINRNEEKAADIAAAVDAISGSDYHLIPSDTDMIIIAVSDQAIEEVAHLISGVGDFKNRTLVAHTSGSTPRTVLSQYFSHTGVFYLLQSFSPGKTPDFAQIPICVDGDPDSMILLEKIAATIHAPSYRIDDEMRKSLHLAAVFANNFTNTLLGISYKLLEQKGIDPGILSPLIRETMDKLSLLGPEKSQTGPAIRKDMNIIRAQIDMLGDHPDWQKLYILLTQNINPDIQDI